MGVRIGGGQGFYGDGHAPLGDLLDAGIDYLVCEALAELTLAILQKDRQRDESLGYTRDLPRYVATALPYLLDGRTRMITNAGGINPIAAGRAVTTALRDHGISGLRIATVVGDDIRPHADALALPDDTLFAHAYLGAAPIVEALDAGAHLVITGRVADASLFLAPLVHEYGWSIDDWDLLAAGVTAGHLLECSGQVTGGNYSGDWWVNSHPARIGFPIGEVELDGTFVMSKPKETGGRVSFDTVREQLLYEVHDPSAYLNPDVTADFSTVRLEDLGDDRVRVTGCTGRAAPDTLKGLVCTPGGWAGEARVSYGWPDAEAKARAALGFLRARSAVAGIVVDEWSEEYFGVNSFGGPTVGAAIEHDPPEVMARLAWRCETREDAARVGADAGLLGLCGPPMIASSDRARGGRPSCCDWLRCRWLVSWSPSRSGWRSPSSESPGPSPESTGGIGSGGRDLSVAAGDEAGPVEFERPARALGAARLGGNVHAAQLRPTDQLGDDVAVAAQHDIAVAMRSPLQQLPRRLDRGAFEQVVVRLRDQAMLLRQRSHRLEASSCGTGDHPDDRRLGQQLGESFGLEEAGFVEGAVSVARVGVVALAGRSVAYQEDRHERAR